MYIIIPKKIRKKATLILSLSLLFFIGLQIINGVSFILPSYSISIDDISIVLPDRFSHGDLYSQNNTTSIQSCNTNNDDYILYQSDLKGISFKYPQTFNVEELTFFGNDIIYHININDKKNIIHGFIQIWNLNTPLKEFLDISETYSSLRPIKIDRNSLDTKYGKGIVWDYTFISTEDELTRALEFFLEKNDKLYRISLFVPAKNSTKEINSIFLNIIESMKIK